MSLDLRGHPGAGALAGAAGLAAAELAAAALAAPSAVDAVASRVISLTPAGVREAVIRTFGAHDKTLLSGCTVVGALLLAAAAGPLERRRRGAGQAWLALGAGLGGLAVAGSPSGGTLDAVVVGLVAAVVAVLALGWLTRPAAAAPGAAVPDPASPRPAGAPADPARRAFLVRSGLVLAAAAVGAGVAASARSRTGAAVEALRARVRLPRARDPLPPPPAAASVPGAAPLFTPNQSFYRIDTALRVPQVDPGTWRLRVTGRVRHPFELTYDDVLGLADTEHDVTLACVSNEVGGPLVGNARWLGVPLARLLDRAGVRAGTDQLVARSVDGFTAGMPVRTVLDGRAALLAVGMNGQPLPLAHGFPARLVVAGLYGYVSATKWLSELELTTFAAYDAFWIRRGWTTDGTIVTESRIDTPRGGTTLRAGTVAVAGVAWAQHRGISKVEVQVDRGPWQQATLAAALNVDTWRLWHYAWPATPGRHTLRVRATDGTGAVQTAVAREPFPGAATGWHTIRVTVR